MTVTRDAANNITGATYDFVVTVTGFPANTTLTGAAYPCGRRSELGVVVRSPADGHRYGGRDRAVDDYENRARQHVCYSAGGSSGVEHLQQPCSQQLSAMHTTVNVAAAPSAASW
jgi:hypothetical protein